MGFKMGFFNDYHSSGRKLYGFFRPALSLGAARRGPLGPAHASPAIAPTLSTTYARLTAGKLLEERSRVVRWLGMYLFTLDSEQTAPLSIGFGVDPG